MKVTLRLPADAPNVSYAPGAFDGWLGRHIPIYGTGLPSSTGEVVSAEVVEDGATVLLTLEAADYVAIRLSEVQPDECRITWAGQILDALVLHPVPPGTAVGSTLAAVQSAPGGIGGIVSRP